jgi:hypothetical protein
VGIIFLSNIKDRINISILDILIVSLLSNGLLLIIATPLPFNLKIGHYIILMLFGLLLSLLFNILLKTKKSFVLCFILLFSASLFLIYILLENTGVLSGALPLSMLNNYITDHIFSGSKEFSKEGFLIICFVQIILCFSSYYIYFFKKRILPVSILFTCIIIFSRLTDYFDSYPGLYIFLIGTITGLLKINHSYIKTNNNNIYNSFSFLIYTLPVLLITVLCSSLLPSTNKSLDFNKLPAFFKSISALFEDGLDISFEGKKKNEKNLLLRPSMNKKTVMIVESPYRTYLRGVSYDYFTGKGWVSHSQKEYEVSENLYSFDKELSDLNTDLLELDNSNTYLNLINSVNVDENLYLKHDVEIKIEYIQKNSNILYVPLKTSKLDIEDYRSDFSVLIDDSGDLYTNKNIKNNSAYIIKATMVDFKNESFINALKAANRESYIGIIQNINTLSARYSENSLENLIVAHSIIGNLNSIYSKYLQLPENLPSEINTLAKEVTGESVSGIEKAHAIENYLSSNYRYTLKPQRKPKDSDFLSHFLFESKEGFCTYYATAMTVMLRTLGIPARYVEGYSMPVENQNNVYYVTNDTAHAWVEAYFEGFGWIPFEPTASVSEIEEIIRSNEVKRNRTILAIIFSSFIVLLLIKVLFNIIKYKKSKKYYISLSDRQKVIYLYNKIFKLLKIINIELKHGETLFNFIDRNKSFFELYNIDFHRVTGTYYIARFSNETVFNSDVEYLQLFYNELLNSIKRNKKLYSFYLKKFAFASI